MEDLRDGWDQPCLALNTSVLIALRSCTLGEKHVSGLRRGTIKRIDSGLADAPPWPVLLPAHVLHAIQVGRAGLPLHPTPDHDTLASKARVERGHRWCNGWNVVIGGAPNFGAPLGAPLRRNGVARLATPSERNSLKGNEA